MAGRNRTPGGRLRGVAKVRLDRLLVERGLAESREKAQGLILAGEVEVEGRRADKAGFAVANDAAVVIRSTRPARVSRAGGKLDGALGVFDVGVAGRRALDVGASTGGFTEVLLQRGAASVIALDVGRGQLHWKLRTDPRVLPVEGVNARYLTPADLPPAGCPIDFAVADVSFISLRLIFPALAGVLPAGEAVVLVKPQFEAGKGKVGRGGILRDEKERERAVRGVADSAAACGFFVRAACLSAVPGAEGNLEFFLHLFRGVPAGLSPELEASLQAALREASEDASPAPSGASSPQTASSSPQSASSAEATSGADLLSPTKEPS